MRPTILDVVEKGRVLTGHYATPRGDRCGSFRLKSPDGVYFLVLAATGEDWEECGLPLPAFEHVSVSVPGVGRCPTWEEMCWVKGLFWGEDELVIQYHPPASVYVSHHPTCLHLWKPVGVDIPLPPTKTIA